MFGFADSLICVLSNCIFWLLLFFLIIINNMLNLVEFLVKMVIRCADTGFVDPKNNLMVIFRYMK